MSPQKPGLTRAPEEVLREPQAPPVGQGNEDLPLMGELHGRVDGIASGAHDIAPSIAKQQQADHLLLPHLAGQVQRGLSLVVHPVQASRCILP